jgi:hypothetical protein
MSMTISSPSQRVQTPNPRYPSGKKDKDSCGGSLGLFTVGFNCLALHEPSKLLPFEKFSLSCRNLVLFSVPSVLFLLDPELDP